MVTHLEHSKEGSGAVFILNECWEVKSFNCPPNHVGLHEHGDFLNERIFRVICLMNLELLMESHEAVLLVHIYSTL